MQFSRTSFEYCICHALRSAAMLRRHDLRPDLFRAHSLSVTGVQQTTCLILYGYKHENIFQSTLLQIHTNNGLGLIYALFALVPFLHLQIWSFITFLFWHRFRAFNIIVTTSVFEMDNSTRNSNEIQIFLRKFFHAKQF